MMTFKGNQDRLIAGVSQKSENSGCEGRLYFRLAKRFIEFKCIFENFNLHFVFVNSLLREKR